MSATAKRLWDKGTAPEERIHRFTVGDDPAWDRYLVYWDCLGSAAHARTLAHAGLLTEAELAALLGGLARIIALEHAGEFAIPSELEDCHTAIEAYLTETCGVAGEKIHTGRSRNDQVATAIRLFMRHHALNWCSRLAEYVSGALERIDREGDVAMPGYSHMRPAMPSSIGQWLHAHAEAALEQVRATLDLLDRLDACPLGTGAGFGVPLPLDRAYAARLLGFGRIQRSPVDVQNSRGRLEKYFVRVAADIAAGVEKLACDLALFSTAEFGFFSLPAELTTGSSLMPQKRNPDVLELLRAHGAVAAVRAVEVEAVGAKLPSGYHRDLQMTKGPMIRAALDTADVLHVATRVLSGFQIHPARLRAAMCPELYATHAALALAQRGTPFRAAYRQIAADLAAGRLDERASAMGWDQTGRVEPYLIEEVRGELAALQANAAGRRERVVTAERALLPEGAAPEPRPEDRRT